MSRNSDINVEALSTARSVHHVTQTKLSAIEHPFLIRDVAKGIQSVGGGAGLSALVRPELRESQVRARLHVSGRLISKPSLSQNVATHNLVLKITTPRRVSRKCKRNTDSSGQARDESPSLCTARQHTHRLLNVMKDRPAAIKIEAVGIVDQTHRFRTLSDFASPEPNSDFTDSLQETFSSGDLSKLKRFHLNMFQDSQADNKIVPPPTYSHLDIPFNYAYRQNAGVLTSVDERGQMTTINSQLAPKVHYQPLPANCDSVPASASPDLPPVASLEPTLQQFILAILEAMKSRPIVTRRCLPSLVSFEGWDKIGQNVFKLCLQYVGYSFASGPWRDALIKFGVDPRKDSRYRVYQTLMFQFDTASRTRPFRLMGSASGSVGPQGPALAPGHIFDGSRLSMDGSVWQVCDITDPVLKALLATDDIRSECHIETDGWYQNGTLAKVKAIMRWKITQLQYGIDTLTDAQIARVAAAVPDNVTNFDGFYSLLSEDATAKERELFRKIRNALKRPKVGEQPETTVDDDPL